jgi:hypothetical protein
MWEGRGLSRSRWDACVCDGACLQKERLSRAIDSDNGRQDTVCGWGSTVTGTVSYTDGVAVRPWDVGLRQNDKMLSKRS